MRNGARVVDLRDVFGPLLRAYPASEVTAVDLADFAEALGCEWCGCIWKVAHFKCPWNIDVDFRTDSMVVKSEASNRRRLRLISSEPQAQ